VVPRGDIFLGKWRSSFAGSSDGKMNVQSTCALNTRHKIVMMLHEIEVTLFANRVSHPLIACSNNSAGI
jgi:hypothetical protein